VCCAGRGLCDGLIPRPGVPPLMCVCDAGVIRCNNNPLHLQRVGRRDQTKEEKRKKEISFHELTVFYANINVLYDWLTRMRSPMISDILVASVKEEPISWLGKSRETRLLPMSAMSSVVVEPMGLAWKYTYCDVENFITRDLTGCCRRATSSFGLQQQYPFNGKQSREKESFCIILIVNIQCIAVLQKVL
jgi:hypothetical protein